MRYFVHISSGAIWQIQIQHDKRGVSLLNKKLEIQNVTNLLNDPRTYMYSCALLIYLQKYIYMYIHLLSIKEHIN